MPPAGPVWRAVAAGWHRCILSSCAALQSSGAVLIIFDSNNYQTFIKYCCGCTQLLSAAAANWINQLFYLI